MEVYTRSRYFPNGKSSLQKTNCQSILQCQHKCVSPSSLCSEIYRNWWLIAFPPHSTLSPLKVTSSTFISSKSSFQVQWLAETPPPDKVRWEVLSLVVLISACNKNERFKGRALVSVDNPYPDVYIRLLLSLLNQPMASQIEGPAMRLCSENQEQSKCPSALSRTSTCSMNLVDPPR